MGADAVVAHHEARTDRFARPGTALRLLGPAYVVAIAYVDPGNFATNFAAGAAEGYTLIWVVVVANVMAALVQYLAARLGAATGRDLCEICRDRLPRPVVRLLWAQAELACMATDLAEVVGAAIALRLLFGIPLLAGGALTGGVTFGVLALAKNRQPRFERAMAAALTVIFGAFVAGSVMTSVRLGGLARGLVPRSADGGGVLLAAGIIGATVMPHAVYAHSALALRLHHYRSDEEVNARRALRRDVVSAMAVAGAGNVAILAVAAAALAGRAGATVTLDAAYRILGTEGSAVAVLFAAALLVAGLASSGVGTYAGQVVMRGFLQTSIPLPARRLVTLLPALAVLSTGLDATRALVLSQVTLSFAIPFAVIPLLIFTRRPDVMVGQPVSPWVCATGTACAVAIVALNVILLAQMV